MELRSRLMGLMVCLLMTGCGPKANPESRELVDSPETTRETARALPQNSTATSPTEPVVSEAQPVGDKTPPVEASPMPAPVAADQDPATKANPADKPLAGDVAATPKPESTAITPVKEGTGVAAMPADPLAATLTPGVPNKIELLIPEKEFRTEGKQKAFRISFDDIDLLKVLNMEPVPVNAETYFPGWLSGLNGKRVLLRGWMYPPPIEDGIPSFLFVRDNQICCFGRLPKVYDKVGVTMRDGVTTDYIQNRPFDVEGTLRIQSEEQDGELMFLYFIDDAIIAKR